MVLSVTFDASLRSDVLNGLSPRAGSVATRSIRCARVKRLANKNS